MTFLGNRNNYNSLFHKLARLYIFLLKFPKILAVRRKLEWSEPVFPSERTNYIWPYKLMKQGVT